MLSLIALLGRRDLPTDGVQDYCEFLGRSLERHQVKLTIARIDWMKNGWLIALWDLWHSSEAWCGHWVILQYTALAWSRRGFPFGAVAVLAILRRRGVRCGVVFHEPHPNAGARHLDWIRGACQSWVIRRIYGLAAKAIFADPLETIGWLPKLGSKATFVPIGANIPERVPPVANALKNDGIKTVAIFCITGGPHASVEIEDIAQAARSAVSASSALRFVFFGRGTPEAHEQIIYAFRDIPVEVSVLGLLGANEISDVLASSDVMLCVRGAVFPRRGSAIAGVSCGLPIVCYGGPETSFPITEAGLELVPYRDRDALGKAVTRVLSDDQLRQELRKRSLRAHAEYFSWEKIAERFVAELFNE
jgi:glycosyltransferase involved in cell wall biosynthesis